MLTREEFESICVGDIVFMSTHEEIMSICMIDSDGDPYIHTDNGRSFWYYKEHYDNDFRNDALRVINKDIESGLLYIASDRTSGRAVFRQFLYKNSKDLEQNDEISDLISSFL